VDVSVLKIGIGLQIDDLLVAGWSAIGHVEVKQYWLALIAG